MPPPKRVRSHRPADHTADHKALLQATKVELCRVFKRAVYCDGLTQWKGRAYNSYYVNAGMANGTFDLFVCAAGKVIWLDAKTGTAKLEPEQLEFQRWIRASGGIAEAFHTVEQAVEIVWLAIHGSRT